MASIDIYDCCIQNKSTLSFEVTGKPHFNLSEVTLQYDVIANFQLNGMTLRSVKSAMKNKSTKIHEYNARLYWLHNQLKLPRKYPHLLFYQSV